MVEGGGVASAGGVSLRDDAQYTEEDFDEVDEAGDYYTQKQSATKMPVDGSTTEKEMGPNNKPQDKLGDSL